MSTNNPFITDDGTDYRGAPNLKVVQALEYARANGLRCRVWYGDTETGEAWPEAHDVTGYISRSCGGRKVPLLVHHKGALGGGAVLLSSIVRIDSTSGGRLYAHGKFTAGDLSIESSPLERGYWVQRNGVPVCFLASHESAQKFIDFLKGDRYRV